MTGTNWNEIREKRLTNKQLRERLDNIESFDKIYNRCCLKLVRKTGKYASNRIIELPPPRYFLVLGATTVVIFTAAT